jgi:alkaline phosphatase
MGALAQDEAETTPVLILPVNNANFLPGVMFDIRIEVHSETLPEDFAATINGEAIGDFFGVDAEQESWQFSEEAADEEELAEVDPETVVTANVTTWRQVAFSEPGEYEVVVTADGAETTANWLVREPQPAAGAKNVILFIADGGSTAVYTAARLMSRGIDQGTYGGNLIFEDFEELGMIHTSGIDSVITDSANSASSYNTGHKTAVNANGVYPDTSYDKLDDPRTEKFAYLVTRLMGKSVGIVTNSHWGDATPNGVYGYGRDRSNSSINAYLAQPLDEGLLPAVIMGGGARNMLPASIDGSRRGDERDLFTEYESAGYTVITTGEELDEAVNGGELPERLMGIFHPNHMDVWLDRHVFTENSVEFPDQPDLDEMTLAALAVLSQNENGFYLEVEGASIDKALHPMDFDRALADTIEFERAVAAAVEWVEANAPDTLIIVTSDHAHSYDVFGTVDTEAFNAAADDSERRNAIRIYQDAGFPTYEDADGDFFPDDWAPTIALAQGKVENPVFTEDYQVSEVYRVPSLVEEVGEGDDAVEITTNNPEDDPNGLQLGGNLPEGANSSVHTLQSVPVYAHGPGSECLGRIQENIEVFFCMAGAIGLDPARAMLPNIVETAVAAGAFETLVTAVTEAGLAETLAGEGPFTVFAPSDDAFAALDPATLEAALADPEGLLTDVLLYHVVAGDVFSGALEDGMEVETLGGGALKIGVAEDGTVTVNDAVVATPDVKSANGVIHVIDLVLLPAAE